MIYAAESQQSDLGSDDDRYDDRYDEFLGALAALGGSADNGRLRPCSSEMTPATRPSKPSC